MLYFDNNIIVYYIHTCEDFKIDLTVCNSFDIINFQFCKIL